MKSIIYGRVGVGAILVICLFIQACKTQELPPAESRLPDFFLKGVVGEEVMDVAAGEAGFFMETGAQSVTTDGVRIASGALSPLGCDDCPGRVEIYLRDHRLREENVPVDLDSLFFAGEYNYYRRGGVPGKQAMRVHFSQEGGNSGSTYIWDFGDGTTHIGPNPVHDYTDSTLITPTVCLETQDPSGCETSICNEVWLTPDECQLDFQHFRHPGTSYVEFAAVMDGEPPFTYRWDFGDGFGATLGNPGYFYTQAGLYTVCVTVTDAAGCERSMCKNIAADPSFCEHNFTYEVEKTELIDKDQLSRVTVVWYDEAGNAFGSDMGEQPANSYFRIWDREDYAPNSLGQSTVRLGLALEATLFNEDGEEVELRIEQGSFGMGVWD